MWTILVGEATPSVTETLTSSFTDIASDITSGIQGVLPIALGIVGTVMVIMFGIKIFKKLTNKANG